MSQPSSDRLLIVAAVVVGAAVAVAAVSWWIAKSYQDTVYQTTTTKGMNGFSGDVLELSCPIGQVISLPNTNPTTSRGALICTGTSTCDPFYIPTDGQTNNFFAKGNIVDVLGNLKSFPDVANCVGKSSCAFTVPSASDLPASFKSSCVSRCTSRLNYVGTYNCGPA